MFDWIKNLFLFKIRKKYYYKMLIFYSLFTIGLLLTLFFLNLSLSNSSLMKEIKKSNGRLLTQVQIYTDKYLFEKVNSIINQYFFNIYSDSSASSFFNYNSKTDLNVTINIYKSLTNTILSNDYINSICLYKREDATIISTNQGINYNILSADIKKPPYPYPDLIKNHMNSLNKKVWISPSENKDFFPDAQTITLIQSIPLYVDIAHSEGFIIFNIDQSQLFSQINKIFKQEDEGELMICDSSGRIFTHSDSSKLTEPLDKSILNSQIFNSDEGFTFISMNDKNFGASWIKSSESGWKYISLVPIESLYKKSIAIERLYYLIIIIIIVLGLIGITIITSKLYKPFITMARKATFKTDFANSSESDIDNINNALSYLSDKIENMEDSINKNKETIKYKAAIDILYGNINKPDEIRKRLELVDIHFNNQNFSIIIAEIDARIFASITAEQKEYITALAVDIINSFFSSRLSSIEICHPSNCIISIVNHNPQINQLRNLDELLYNLKAQLGTSFNIAVSKDTTELIKLDVIYKETLKYLKYSYIYGFNNIFTFSKIDRYELSNINIDQNIISQMEILLKSSKLDKLKTLFDEQVKLITLNGYSYKYTQELLLQTLGLISRICREQGITSELFDRATLTADFNRATNLNESVLLVYSIIDVYNDYISKRNDSIDTEFINKIAEFVCRNIENQLSRDSVATEFNISTSHLSRLFKEGLNVGFSDFIQDKKLDRFVELLVQNTNGNISEIEERLGYFTPAYFSKIFKEKYGMTPAMYKKKMLSQKQDN